MLRLFFLLVFLHFSTDCFNHSEFAESNQDIPEEKVLKVVVALNIQLDEEIILHSLIASEDLFIPPEGGAQLEQEVGQLGHRDETRSSLVIPSPHVLEVFQLTLLNNHVLTKVHFFKRLKDNSDEKVEEDTGNYNHKRGEVEVAELRATTLDAVELDVLVGLAILTGVDRITLSNSSVHHSMPSFAS